MAWASVFGTLVGGAAVLSIVVPLQRIAHQQPPWRWLAVGMVVAIPASAFALFLALTTPA